MLTKAMDLIKLFFINFKVSLFNALDFFIVALKYYPNSTFAKVDLALLWSYFFQNPFRISKRFLIERKASEIYAYGETPLSSFEEIVDQCEIGPQDIVYELGAGRGRLCFWLNAFIGCRVVGIEYIPEFVQKAQDIQKKYQLQHLEFICEDMLKANIDDATVVYLYGSCLEDDAIAVLVEKFAKLPKGTKIITTSYSLAEYDTRDRFEVAKQFSVRFTWGTGEVYLNIKK